MTIHTIKAGFKKNQRWVEVEYFQGTVHQVINVFAQRQLDRLQERLMVAEENLSTVEQTFIPEHYDYYNQKFAETCNSLRMDIDAFKQCKSYEDLVRLPNMSAFYIQEIHVEVLSN